MKDIVCLSTTRFDSVPTRKQNVMKRLKYSRVLYFNPPITIAAPLKDKTSFKYLFSFMKSGKDVEKNIKVYDLPPILPLFNKNRKINKINQWLIARYVNFRMAQNYYRNVILWCYSPSNCDAVKYIQHTSLVYDCVDRHSGYVGMINPQVVENMEQDLAQKCDIVYATAVGLYENLKKQNENTYLIPNGCAYELFNRANTEKFDKPLELQGVTGKVFAFVGMFQECIDYTKIELIARNFPNDTILMIGKTLPGVDIEYLKQYENVIIRGLVPQEELPKYMSNVDVCLNVFNKGMLSKDVSPLKFYEYLATGKPIICTSEPLQVNDFADAVYIADKDEEFLDNCKKALDEKDNTKQNKRLEYAKECSWDQRVLEMERLLTKHKII